jgi:hypothetical protein
MDSFLRTMIGLGRERIVSPSREASCVLSGSRCLAQAEMILLVQVTGKEFSSHFGYMVHIYIYGFGG